MQLICLTINIQVSRHSLDQRKLQALNNLKEIIKTGKIIPVNLGLFQEKENKEVYTNFCGASVYGNGVILSASHCFEEVDLKTGKIGLDQLGNSLQNPHIIYLSKHSLIRAGDITIIYPQSEEGRQSALKLVQEMYLANQELQTNSILAMVTKMGSSNGSFGHSKISILFQYSGIVEKQNFNTQDSNNLLGQYQEEVAVIPTKEYSNLGITAGTSGSVLMLNGKVVGIATASNNSGGNTPFKLATDDAQIVSTVSQNDFVSLQEQIERQKEESIASNQFPDYSDLNSIPGTEINQVAEIDTENLTTDVQTKIKYTYFLDLVYNMGALEPKEDFYPLNPDFLSRFDKVLQKPKVYNLLKQCYVASLLEQIKNYSENNPSLSADELVKALKTSYLFQNAYQSQAQNRTLFKFVNEVLNEALK